MKQLISLIVFLVLVAGIVSAQDAQESAEDKLADLLAVDTEGLTEQEIVDAQKQQLLSELATFQEIYNENHEQLPGPVNLLFGNERMNVNLDGGSIFNVVTTNGLVTSISDGAAEDPTVNIYVHDAVFADLNAETFDLTTALDEEDISFSGVGFFKKAKFGVAKIILGFFAN